ncbi:MAG: hypothetical protein BWY95_01003 [Bacteroidetes bacterium ADurb.BinA104]|nr:MAG: hypothetical protein BWY95_01003 [Bacteroidetes bacterium ADurb.BinA104]
MAQIIWPIRICDSCMRGVESEGTFMQRSARVSMGEGLLPVKAIDSMPFSRQTLKASIIFSDFPDVEMPIKTSPLTP